MTYKISDRTTLQVLGEYVANSFNHAANQMCRNIWGINFDTAVASGYVRLSNLSFTAKTF